jgi:Ca2+-binding RTX toxin-like protein
LTLNFVIATTLVVVFGTAMANINSVWAAPPIHCPPSTLTNPCVGTPQGDKMLGTADDDVMMGLNGQDEMFGFARDDQMFSNNGNDTMKGDSGDDNMHGNERNDNINGESGDDIIRGRFW